DLAASQGAEGGEARARAGGGAAAHLRSRPGRVRGDGRLARRHPALLAREPRRTGARGGGRNPSRREPVMRDEAVADGEIMDAHTVRFERVLPGPIERVWACLTEPEKRRTWLAGGTMELREGG